MKLTYLFDPGVEYTNMVLTHKFKVAQPLELDRGEDC